MIFVSDFFARKKEAVSIQIELLARQSNGKVVAAAGLMGQRPLRKEEIRDRIFIFPEWLYSVLLPMIALFTKQPIHYFEEDPSGLKRFIFNVRKRSQYISVYARPTKKYALHVAGYKYLEKVFVELDTHKDILVSHGVDERKVLTVPTPAKLQRKRSAKQFDPKNITILFASWNNEEQTALHDRGVIYLLDLLEKNPALSLDIALRDQRVEEFWQEAKKRHVEQRVALHEVSNERELVELFDKADFVALTAQARVVKDVPNSLVDGMMLGKPALLTDILDFSHTVAKHKLGIVIPAGRPAGRFAPTAKEYAALSRNAYEYSQNHTIENYLKITQFYKGKNE